MAPAERAPAERPRPAKDGGSQPGPRRHPLGRRCFVLSRVAVRPRRSADRSSSTRSPRCWRRPGGRGGRCGGPRHRGDPRAGAPDRRTPPQGSSGPSTRPAWCCTPGSAARRSPSAPRGRRTGGAGLRRPRDRPRHRRAGPTVHAVRYLLLALTGAEDALVVNNGAAALLLALAALARGSRSSSHRASSSRSAASSGSPTSSPRRARGSSRSAPRTARGPPTTARRSRTRPRSC